MASPKIEDLQKITNIMEMCQVLAKLGISLEGVQTIDEMRALAIAEIAGQSSEKPSWSPGQVRTGIFILYSVNTKWQLFAISHCKN